MILRVPRLRTKITLGCRYMSSGQRYLLTAAGLAAGSALIAPALRMRRATAAVLRTMGARRYPSEGGGMPSAARMDSRSSSSSFALQRVVGIRSGAEKCIGWMASLRWPR